MIDTEALRKQVLELDISGKLVEQLAEEGDATELIEANKRKKEELVELGTLKKEKIQKDIKLDDVPYTIPDNWKWVRLGDYCQKVTDQVASGSFASLRENVKSYKEPNCAIMVKTADFSNGFTENLTYTDKRGYEFLSNSNLYGGELILSNIGSIGKCFIVPDLNTNMTLAPNAVMVRLIDGCQRDYLYYFLLSTQGFKELMDISTGIAMIKFNKTDLKTILVPIPPIKEQIRINEKVKEIFSILDEIDKLQEQNCWDRRVLRAKIIDAAIQGQLTEQLKEDGNVEQLLKDIYERKQALKKERNVKIPKKLPDLDEEEIPFKIPENWKWTCIGNVCVNIQYGTSKKSQKEGLVPVIRMGNLQNGEIVYDNLVYSSDEEEIETYRLEMNDLLFNRTNSWELVGKTAIYKGEKQAIYAGYLIRITPILLSSDYLNYVMQSGYYWKYCDSVKIGAVNQANINLQKLQNFYFPLPPIREQHRIVEKIEAVLKIID